MTEVLITAPCSDEIKLRLEEFKNSCIFSFGDRKNDIGGAEVVAMSAVLIAALIKKKKTVK